MAPHTFEPQHETEPSVRRPHELKPPAAAVRNAPCVAIGCARQLPPVSRHDLLSYDVLPSASAPPSTAPHATRAPSSRMPNAKSPPIARPRRFVPFAAAPSRIVGSVMSPDGPQSVLSLPIWPRKLQPQHNTV